MRSPSSFLDSCPPECECEQSMAEYLDRNLAVCSSIGAGAAAEAAIKRLSQMKRPPKWLLKQLAAIVEREAKIRPHLVAYRALVSPYRRNQS